MLQAGGGVMGLRAPSHLGMMQGQGRPQVSRLTSGAKF